MAQHGRSRWYAIATMAVFIVCLGRMAAAQSVCGTPHLPDLTGWPEPVDSHVASAPPARVGDRRTFFTHIPEGRLRAALRHVGTHAAYWVDERLAEIADDAAIRRLAREFDDFIYPRVHEWVGSERLPGVDGDFRITVLFHDVEANESAQGFGGYFSQADEHPALDNSNAREMLYLDVYALRDYELFRFNSLVAHELTHVVNWNERGGRLDERWLEEGRATFAEWAIYGKKPQLFLAEFLSDPSVSLTSENTLATWYGGSYLLLLYAFEHFGGRRFSHALATSPFRGITAIEQAVLAAGRSETFSEVFAWWALGALLNDKAAHARAGYDNLRPDQHVSPSRVVRHRSYPASGRARVKEWATAYVELTNPPKGTLTVSVEGDVSAALVPWTWRPDQREFSAVSAREGGLWARTFHDLRPNETIVLVLTTSADQDATYRVEASDEAGVETPRPPTDQVPVVERFTTRDLLELGPGRVGEAEPIGSLPFAGQVNSVALTQTGLWATTGWGVLRFERDDAARPRLLGWFETDGRAQNVVADEELAVIAQGSGGVVLVDARTGARVGSARAGGSVVAVARRGDWVFALDEASGLRTVDIADPASPLIAGVLPTGAGLDVHVRADRLYLSDLGEGLRAFALDGLPDLRPLWRVELPVRGLEAREGLVWGGRGPLVTFDARALGNVEVREPYPRVGPVTDVAAVASTLVTVEDRAGLSVVDVSDPFDPRAVARLATRGRATAVHTDGRWVAIGDGPAGLSVVDVGDPSAPVAEWHYDTSGSGRGVTVSDGLAYVAMGVGGVLVARALNAALIGSEGVIPTLGGSRAIAVADGRALVATSVGLELADVRDAARPVYLSASELAEPASDVALMADGRTAVVAAGDVVVFAVADDSAAVLGRADVQGFASSVVLRGEVAYVGALDGGIAMVDVSTRERPAVLGRTSLGVPARSVAIDDARLIVGAGGEIVLYDLEVTFDPHELHRWRAGFDVRTVAARDGRVFAAGEDSFAGWDARDATSPVLLVESRSLTWAGGIALGSNKLLIADVDRLHIYRRTDDGVPLSVDDALVTTRTFSGQATELVNGLGQSFPNPFSAEVRIPFTLVKDAIVEFEILDETGRTVHKLDMGLQRRGRHDTPATAALWDGLNALGEPVSVGIYFYRIRAFSVGAGVDVVRTGRMVRASRPVP